MLYIKLLYNSNQALNTNSKSLLFIALIVMNSELFMLIIDILKGDFVKSSTSVMFATPANEGRCALPY